MKTKIVIIASALVIILTACGSMTSGNKIETQVAATIAAGQTATIAIKNQVEAQVAETIAAGQTMTAVFEESLIKTSTAIALSATPTLSPSPELQNTVTSTQAPIQVSQNADAIAGSWSGTEGYSGQDQTQVKITIQANCTIGSVCGSISYPQYGCSGNIVLTKIKNDTTFVIRENITSGGEGCTSQTGGSNTLVLNSDGTLSLKYYFADGRAGATGVLRK